MRWIRLDVDIDISSCRVRFHAQDLRVDLVVEAQDKQCMGPEQYPDVNNESRIIPAKVDCMCSEYGSMAVLRELSAYGCSVFIWN